MTKPVARAAGVTLVLVALLGAAWGIRGVRSARPVDLATLSAGEWRDDLQYLARELARRHAAPYHRIAKERYWQLVAGLDSALPHLAPADIPVHFATLTAAVGDAHTYLSLPDGQHFFPFGIYYFADTPRVTRTTAADQDLLGARLVAIDGTDMAGVQARLDQILTQGENAWFYRAHYPGFLSREVLHALGIVADTATATFTFERDDGSTVTRAMAPMTGAAPEWVRPYEQPPLYIAHGDADWWVTTLPHTDVVYVAFNSYRHLSANAARLFDTLDRHPSARLVLDLRGNTGGDYLEGHKDLIAPVAARPGLDRRGHLYVITGRYTFSAAMNNAAQFRTETHATLVGEPPGEVPNGYQERRAFRLPNSHLMVSYSTQYYKFLPADVQALLPDVEVDPAWDSYRAGRDPALEWILADPAATP